MCLCVSKSSQYHVSMCFKFVLSWIYKFNMMEMVLNCSNTHLGDKIIMAHIPVRRHTMRSIALTCQTFNVGGYLTRLHWHDAFQCLWFWLFVIHVSAAIPFSLKADAAWREVGITWHCQCMLCMFDLCSSLNVWHMLFEGVVWLAVFLLFVLVVRLVLFCSKW